MVGMASPLGLLKAELRQRRDEGCSIPDDLVRRIDSLDSAADEWNTTVTEELYDGLMSLSPGSDLAAREPDELEAIRGLRPAGHVDDMSWSPSDEELFDRFHGAWTGRCCGCASGKPVEAMGMRVVRGELAGRTSIKAYLEAADAWPLRDYFPAVAGGEELPCVPSTLEHIAFMEPDDDINYSLIGLMVLEESGPDFSWLDVANAWTARIPFGGIFTAETQAVLNYWNNSARMGRRRVNTTPEHTRLHRNPYREWIGAQIRSDGWAWACAGKPGLAAEFAYRDACWTHTRNGIYGEMFMAAMQAAAFVESDPHRLLEIGLGQIPAECRLARGVRACLGWIDADADWEAVMDRLEAQYPEMSPVHTINNALICVMALVLGDMDTRVATTISVMAGLDTDCNGASVGSIVGAAAGRSGFDESFASPLNDTVKSTVIGVTETTMTELAHRHLAVWKTVDQYAASRQMCP